jgi:phosphoesterase RecJ-like protein
LADEYLIDETASATALIIHDWAQAAGWPLDDHARLALYVGLVTDTGWFRFANTDARTLTTAAALVASGVRPAQVFEQVYQNEPAARVRLLAAVMSTLELHHHDRLAVMTITRQAFAQTGASPTDTEDLVNYPLQVATVDVSVLLVEQEDGGTRVSFRSKAPSETRPDIDVATVAKDFAGGGHRRAAAARVSAPVDRVKTLVIDRVAERIHAV